MSKLFKAVYNQLAAKKTLTIFMKGVSIIKLTASYSNAYNYFSSALHTINKHVLGWGSTTLEATKEYLFEMT